MDRVIARLTERRAAILVILAVAAATIGGGAVLAARPRLHPVQALLLAAPSLLRRASRWRSR